MRRNSNYINEDPLAAYAAAKANAMGGTQAQPAPPAVPVAPVAPAAGMDDDPLAAYRQAMAARNGR